MTVMHPTIFTIGHSNHPVEEFLSLLKSQAVELLVDVRSAPFSRFSSHFNRGLLAASLRQCGMEYLFLGNELGARSDDPSCYEGGRVQYDRLAATALFRSGIDRVLRESSQHQVALMCAEKEPLDCHRTLLVAPALAHRACSVVHILADGSVEPHVATLQRLLSDTGTGELDLFRSPEEVLSEAIARQQQKIAYVDHSMASSATGGTG